MKPEIQKRMNDAIATTTIINQLFDLIVETSETSLDRTATFSYENQYSINTDLLAVRIVCNDNMFNTLSINIDYAPSMTHIADFNVAATGTFDETYHNIPKACRNTVFSYASDISDALEGFINKNNLSDLNAEGDSINE